MKKSYTFWRIYMAKYSNWWLYIGIFLCASGIGTVVGVVFVAVWMFGHLKEKKLGGTEIHHHYNNKYDGDRFNENHEYKIVNVKAGREKGTYKFDGQLGEWK